MGRDILQLRTCAAQGTEGCPPGFMVGTDRFQKDSSFGPRDLHLRTAEPELTWEPDRLRPAVLEELGRNTHIDS